MCGSENPFGPPCALESAANPRRNPSLPSVLYAVKVRKSKLETCDCAASGNWYAPSPSASPCGSAALNKTVVTASAKDISDAEYTQGTLGFGEDLHDQSNEQNLEARASRFWSWLLLSS